MQPKTARAGCWAGSIGLVIAIPSALLATAPFTPGIVTVGITAPLAICAIWLRAYRTGALAVTWAILTVLALPNMPDFIGAFALVTALLSIIAMPFLWHNYRHSASVYSDAN